MSDAKVFWRYYKDAKTAHMWEPYRAPMWRTACGRVYVTEREYLNHVHLPTEANTKVSQCKLCLKRVGK